MGRKSHLLDSLGRVLELTERFLRERVGEVPDAELFRRYQAFRFRVVAGRGRLVPIESPDLFDLEDLVGVSPAVARLVGNVAQFVAGHPANHMLLYGERGTGKSSAVKGLLTRFAESGLRVVEVRKEALLHLPEVLESLRGAEHRFLIFCDDLSFDAGEAHYRELKAALEGSLAAPAENVRIVATSNRRHLMPQMLADNREAHLDESGELHVGESLDEKLALADRFGLVLAFYPFNQTTYLEIVDHYAKRAGLELDPGEIRAQALRWALDRSSRSGRTARQFVDDLAGREALSRSKKP